MQRSVEAPVPAGTIPDQRTSSGTRIPPSYRFHFEPRSGPLTVYSGCPPLSEVTTTRVWSLVDDLTWSDLGCYGHAWHATPHFDRIARDAMRFTDAYAPGPICSASRASILTGKTTARLNYEFVTKERPGRQQLDAPTPLAAPPFTLNLPLEEQTIAERLAVLDHPDELLPHSAALQKPPRP